MIDRFRSSTWGWLRGTLAGWGTMLLIAGGLIASFYFLAQGTLAAVPGSHRRCWSRGWRSCWSNGSATSPRPTK